MKAQVQQQKPQEVAQPKAEKQASVSSILSDYNSKKNDTITSKNNTGKAVIQPKLIIEGRDVNEQRIKKSRYKKILNSEADDNGIARGEVKSRIINLIKDKEDHHFSTWRQAIVESVDTKLELLTPHASSIDGSYMLNVGYLETVSMHGKKCVKAYLTVFKPSLDGAFKDVQQADNGKIKANSKGAKDTFWINFGRPLRAVKWFEKYNSEKGSDPKVRCFLIPIETYNNITRKSVPELFRGKHSNSSFNVDVHYEPNQFGLTEDDLKELNSNAIPYSLTTYGSGPDKDKEENGRKLPISALQDSLGVPKEKGDLGVFVNSKKGEFTKRDKFKRLADDLMLVCYSSTTPKKKWDDRFFQDFAPVFSKVPDKESRIKKLEKKRVEIMESLNLTEDDIPKLIHKLGLLASHARISELIANDYDEDYEKFKSKSKK